MGKDKSEQSLARRNGVDVVRGGSAGVASGPPTTIDQPTTTSAAATAVAEDNDAGRQSVPDKPEVGSVVIEVPWIEPIGGYYRRSVNCVKLTKEQGIKIKAITAGLEQLGAVLRNGRPVDCAQNAVKWMIENAEIDVSAFIKKFI